MKLEAISCNGALCNPTNPSDWSKEGGRMNVRYSDQKFSEGDNRICVWSLNF